MDVVGTSRKWFPTAFATVFLCACVTDGSAKNPWSESGGDETGKPSDDSANDGRDDGADSRDAPEEESGESGDVPPPPPPGVLLPLDGEPIHARFVRLTHTQWERSVRDLLRLSELPGLSTTFVPDPPSGKFTNNELRLHMTADLTSDYMRAAESLAVAVTSDPAALARLTGGSTDPSTFIREFGFRAFRRPLEADEQQTYEALFASAPALTGAADAFAGGVRLVIEGMLASPYFIYRIELAEEGEPLSPYELATKLSLFLRNTIPDEAMLEAAADGSLATDAGLRAEVERLLALPDAMESFRQFYSELLRTHRYQDIKKDPYAFPDFDPALPERFLAADLRFFDHLFETDQGLRGLLLDTAGFIDAATAPYYGMRAFGNGLTAADLDDRPGYFTRLGFLALNGTLREPDPIHRGVEILREVMCVELAPPPLDIPPLPPEEEGVTNRERVTAHTGPGTCGASCHGSIINPIGFAFENYDAVGMWRELDHGQPVDASGTYDLGEVSFTFTDGLEMLRLMADTPQAHACYAKRIAEFVLAREIAEDDAAEIYAWGDASASDASLEELVMSIVLSPSFRTHQGGEP